MIPAKYPSKVKLENFHNSRVSKLGEIMHTLVCEGFGVFYSSIGLTSVPWHRGHFLVGKIFINTCVLRDPFLVGIPLIGVSCGAQDISLYTYA